MSQGPVGKRFLRSVRLECDWQDPHALSYYVLTPQVRQILRRLVDALSSSSTERAWTITGPYGTGKSAFALFALSLLTDRHDANSEAWRLLRQHDALLAEDLMRRLNGRRFFPLPITARRTSLTRCLLTAVTEALMRLPASSDIERLRSRIEGLLASGVETIPDLREIIATLESLLSCVQQAGYCGIVIVIDELGKVLEYAARDPHHGDIFLLQELAEYASRSGERPVLLLGILHQAFDQYARHLDTPMRREWAKVQGRYADVAFIEPPEQLIRLAADAIAGSNALVGLSEASIAAVAASAASADLGLHPRSIDPASFASLAARAAPLHPVVLVVLPYLFRRLAQSERSLFTYLLGQEPFGFQDFIKHRPGTWVRISDLFDYVAANLAGSVQRHTLLQRWLEVVHKLEELPDLGPREAEIIKTVGVLDVLAEGSHLRATPDLISFALTDRFDDDTVATALDQLTKRSVLVYRRFSRSYRVWEGSDVDIAARIDEARSRIVGQYRLAEALRRYLPPRPQVARRHSYEIGALRFFEVWYLDEPPIPGKLRPREGDGVIACCLPINQAQLEAFRQWASSGEPATRADIIVALPEQLGQLQDATAELVALNWVRDNTPSLRDDRVARRELDLRLAEVESEISQLIERLLDPRPSPRGTNCAWYWLGHRQEVTHPRAVAALLSDAMDQVYARCPRIRNELINRRTLSSAAAAARRNLIERMLTSPEQARLGIVGSPPERAIYESVLHATGLHRADTTGRWSFQPPSDDEDRARLAPVWKEMERLVFAAIEEPIAVNRLFSQLTAPPYGAMEGVLPILLCAFLQVHRNAVSLYREGTFLPELSVADFEVLMRRPELFAVGGVRLTGARQAVIERLARGLNVEPAVLPVVRALLRMVRSLPEHAWRTRQLPPEVIQVREACATARAPERLLFYDLPVALGEMPFGDTEDDPERIARFFDRLNWALTELGQATPRLIAASRDALLQACGLPVGISGWRQLREIARQLNGVTNVPMLEPFLRRLSSDQDDATTVESILALVANRPPRAWTDGDMERFQRQATVIGEQFRELAAAHEILTPHEEAICEAIVGQLRDALPADVPRHVLRVALLRLLRDTT